MKKMIRGFFPFLLFFLVSNRLSAQNLEWAKQFGGPEHDEGTAITVDDSGNVFVTGYFNDTADFDPGPGKYYLIDTFRFGRGMFVMKLNAGGNLVWARGVSGLGSVDPRGIALGKDGSVYVSGTFNDSQDFDPGPGQNWVQSNGFGDLFVLKLNPSGTFNRVIHMGNLPSNGCFSLSFDRSGDLLIAGYFVSNFDFDPGPGTYNLKAVSSYDVFLAKYTPDCEFIWAKSFGGSFEESALSLCFDARENIYLSGFYRDSVDFDPGATVYRMYSRGHYDAFVLKLDKAGNFIWVRGMGGKGTDQGMSISIDGKGDLIQSGSFQDRAIFYPSPGSDELVALGNTDVYVMKLDTQGNLLWKRSMGGTQMDYGWRVRADENANCLILGVFKGVTDVDPDPSATRFLTAKGDMDFYVAKLDASGNLIWAAQFAGDSTNRGFDLYRTSSGRFYITGSFLNNIDMDPGWRRHSLVSNGRSDVFVARLNEATAGEEIIRNPSALLVYPNPTNGILYLVSGSKIEECRISDMQGRMLEHFQPNEKEVQVRLQEPGWYLLTLITEGKRVSQIVRVDR